MFRGIKRILFSGLCFSLLLILPSAGHAQAIKPWGQIVDSSQRFVVLSDFSGNSVLDRSTGLIWDKSPEGGSFTWAAAQNRCIFVGNGDNNLGWRLPKVEELFSLFKFSGGSPGGPLSALVTGHPFTLPTQTRFWSASDAQNVLDLNDHSQAWYANTGVTGGIFGFTDKTETLGVWCVRGGAN